MWVFYIVSRNSSDLSHLINGNTNRKTIKPRMNDGQTLNGNLVHNTIIRTST